MAIEFVDSVTFTDQNGNLVKHDDYFDTVTNMPIFKETILKYNHKKIVGPEYTEISRETVRCFTGADIEVIKWRDKFGKIHTDEKVVRLNTGDDDDCGCDRRWP